MKTVIVETTVKKQIEVESIEGNEPDMIRCPICKKELTVQSCDPSCGSCDVDSTFIISYECMCGFEGTREIELD